METTFQIIIVSLSAIIALISFLLTLLSLIFTNSTRKIKLRKAKEKHFQSILKSDDLITIGNYLDNIVGKFNVYEYITSSQVSSTVNKYLDLLRSFVGTEESIQYEIKKIRTKKTRPKKYTKAIAFPNIEYEKIYEELQVGETWNALARLRRYIEMTLNEFAKKNDININRFSSAGYLLRELFRKNKISKSNFLNLKDVISICNRAVHGIDTSVDVTEEALYTAIRALANISKELTMKDNQ